MNSCQPQFLFFVLQIFIYEWSLLETIHEEGVLSPIASEIKIITCQGFIDKDS